jgi:phosphatidylglycerophosphate synthase
MTLNTLDGVMAIERGTLTSRGEVVNALPDRYSDIFVLAGIALSPLCRPWLGLAAIASMFLVSYTGMLGKALGVSWQHHGPLGKVERLILLMVFSVVQYVLLPGRTHIHCLGITASPIEWAMILFIILGQITVVKRLRGQLREMARKEADERLDPNRNSGTALVVYDSMTGNTATVAREIAKGLGCSSVPVSECPDVSSYSLVVLGTPNIRKEPSSAMQQFQARTSHRPQHCAVFATYGMPVWGQISTPACLTNMARAWHIKPVARFSCKGFHAKYKTYRGHPANNDLLSAYLFGLKLSRIIN